MTAPAATGEKSRPWPGVAGANLGWCTMLAPGAPASVAAAGQFDDVMPDVLALLCRRLPPLVVVLVDNADAVPGLAAAMAHAVGTLPTGHPRRAPLLVLDVLDPAMAAVAEPDDPLPGLVAGDALLLLPWVTSLRPRHGARLREVASAALMRGAAVTLAVPADAWAHLSGGFCGPFDDPAVVDATAARSPHLLIEHLRTVAGHIEAFHAATLTFAAEAVTAAATLPATAAEHDHAEQPWLGRARLDSAAALAVSRRESVVTPDHVHAVTGGPDRPRRPEHGRGTAGLAERLRARVRGQDDAIGQVVGALRARGAWPDGPEPDGAFLLAGPTGTGKTLLGHALADTLDRPLVEVNLGGVTDGTVVATLRGAAPSYVGYHEREHLLSTRIAAAPHAVVLLNEIEKAPAVWPVLLEMCGEGTFTDAAGITVPTRDLIIVATSNLGSHAFTPTTTGFTSGVDEKAAVAWVRTTIDRTLPPEVRARLTVVVFGPLTGAGLAGVVDTVVDTFLASVAARGYTVEVDTAARVVLGAAGSTREHGARPVRTAVRDLLAAPLADLPPGPYRVTAAGGTIRITPHARGWKNAGAGGGHDDR